MTAQVIPLTIRSDRQDKLAHEIALQRLARINQQAAWRAEILGAIDEAERRIMEAEQVIFYGHQLLDQLDGGPDAA